MILQASQLESCLAEPICLSFLVNHGRGPSTTRDRETSTKREFGGSWIKLDAPPSAKPRGVSTTSIGRTVIVGQYFPNCFGRYPRLASIIVAELAWPEQSSELWQALVVGRLLPQRRRYKPHRADWRSRNLRVLVELLARPRHLAISELSDATL